MKFFFKAVSTYLIFSLLPGMLLASNSNSQKECSVGESSSNSDVYIAECECFFSWEGNCGIRFEDIIPEIEVLVDRSVLSSASFTAKAYCIERGLEYFSNVSPQYFRNRVSYSYFVSVSIEFGCEK